jgi:hypothetical protein
MKLWIVAASGFAFLFPLTSVASKTAQATISCYSAQFQRGSEPNGNYYLSLTSLSGSVNGELALDFLNSGYTHSAYLNLEDELFGETLSGVMGLDVPTGGDANGDGFPDFFQVSQGINNLITSGAYNLQIYGGGTVTATWNRQAGSSYGTCTLTMPLMSFGTVTFTHTFQILEYKGPLVYTPSTNSVSGTVELAQTDNPTAVMTGPVTFLKSAGNPHNDLTLQAFAWTNELQTTLYYLNDDYSRDTGWPTNYYGYLDFNDPLNPTGLFPYATWLFSIDDLNDSNHNGIPDFSDDPSASVVPRSPQLQVAYDGKNFQLTLHGDVGYINDIQQISDLTSTNWQVAVSVTITNDPQTVSLPGPAAGQSFWRVRAR